MGIRDVKHILAAAQAFTTDAVSENDLNLAAASKELGLGGRPLFVHFLTTVAAGGAASGVRLAIVDDTVTIATGTSRIISETGILTAAQLAINREWCLPVPPGKLQQYLGARVIPVSEAITGMTMNIWIDDVPPRALTILGEVTG